MRVQDGYNQNYPLSLSVPVATPLFGGFAEGPHSTPSILVKSGILYGKGDRSQKVLHGYDDHLQH
jgi:hypothetical protein